MLALPCGSARATVTSWEHHVVKIEHTGVLLGGGTRIITSSVWSGLQHEGRRETGRTGRYGREEQARRAQVRHRVGGLVGHTSGVPTRPYEGHDELGRAYKLKVQSGSCTRARLQNSKLEA